MMFIVFDFSCPGLAPSLGRYSPLRNRILKPVKEPTTTTSDPKKVNRPLNYRTWNELNMREAIDAVNMQGMPVSKAATLYGIPRSTLNNHCCGRVLPGAKSGRPTMLSSTEEQDLVQFLLSSAKIGCPRTRAEVITMVERMLIVRGDPEKQTVTLGWWNKFSKQHPELVLRTPSTLSFSRASASTSECINCYFDVLEKVLDDNDLYDQPSLIFNMDKTGFPLDPSPLKTIHERGEKNPISVTSGSKLQVTVVACVSASGQTIPPLIIWKRNTMSPDMAVGEIPGTQYGFSDSGWMMSKLFDSWFRKHFMRYAPVSRPLLLLLDGHSSHYCPDTLKLAAENDIIILALPPNTTHLTQPLDKGVFGPFKTHWKRVCHDFQVSHPGHIVNYYNFCSLFSKAWIESMTSVNIMAGFETTGIYEPGCCTLSTAVQVNTIRRNHCSTNCVHSLQKNPRRWPIHIR